MVNLPVEGRSSPSERVVLSVNIREVDRLMTEGAAVCINKERKHTTLRGSGAGGQGFLSFTLCVLSHRKPMIHLQVESATLS